MSYKTLFALILACWGLLPLPAAGGESFAGKRVLVVHSYDRGFAWTADIDEALQRALLPRQVQMRTYFMNTNLQSDEAHLEEAGREATAIMLEFRPDVVITSDDNAQQYFAAQFAGNASAPSFVFCGVNKDPAIYGFPAVNVTGVVEKLLWAEGLELLRRLEPSIRSVMVLLDGRPSSRAEVLKMRDATPPDVRADFSVVETYADWRRSVLMASATHDALVIMTYHQLTGNDGRPVPSEDVMLWTRDNAVLPTLGFYDYTLADGALCGVILTGFEHGSQAAGLALRILAGERAGDIPLTTTTKGLIMLNLAVARKLGVEVPIPLLQEAAALVE